MGGLWQGYKNLLRSNFRLLARSLASAIATLLVAGIVMSFYLIVSGFYFFVDVGKVIFRELFKEELQEPKEKSRGKGGR
jgi:ABC-type multidrug transport system permease subunit